VATTILLYGRTGSGKTSQIGRLAEHVKLTTGLDTRIYSADAGGMDTLTPHIELGFVHPEIYSGGCPWIWLNKVVNGFIRKDGKWVKDEAENKRIGFYAFESAHAVAKMLKSDMEHKAANGINIGGDTNSSFQTQDGSETLKIGTTKGFQKFSIPQTRVNEEMLVSQKLPAAYVLWTAGVGKDDDDIINQKIVGPDVLGRALTGTLPMDFNYTFRIDAVPQPGGKAAKHILYLGVHQDLNSGNAMALGNIRRPLDAPELKQATVEPADIVQALKLVRDDAKEAAKTQIAKRLGMTTTK
jgi:hypothetical protein